MPTAAQLQQLTHEIIKLAQAHDYPALAGKLAYRGPFKSKEFAQPFDYTDAHDQRQVEATANRIIGFMEGVTAQSGGVTFGDVYESVTDGLQWHAIEVYFNLGPDRRVRYFGYVQAGTQLLLGDIDR
jgi:hypothetical protein